MLEAGQHMWRLWCKVLVVAVDEAGGHVALLLQVVQQLLAAWESRSERAAFLRSCRLHCNAH